MSKIIELLTKAGCNPELVTSIVESLDEYKLTIKEQFDADYTAKITEAKKICIEETEAHKRELSRRVQIFLETKSATIDAHLTRQSALNESEAMAKLRNVKSLIEGVVEVNNSQADNGTVTAVVENAKRKMQKLAEERDNAVATANRQTAIAEKVLRQNRALTTECARLKQNGAVVTESQHKAKSRQPHRIDGTRTNGQPSTTRPTIIENQTRRPAAPNTAPIKSRGGFGVPDIAETMDEDLI